MPKLGYFTPSRFADAMTDGRSASGYKGTYQDYTIFTENDDVLICKEGQAETVCPVGTKDVVAKAISTLLGTTKKAIADVLEPIKGVGGEAIGLAYEVAMERLGVQPEEVFAPALDWGNSNEPLAIKRYTEEALSHIEMVFEPFVHPDYDFVAGTPDGLVGTEGIIEVKCPWNPKNHLLNFVNGHQIKQYNPQMQGYMWITSAKWCDFVSYDPRYPKEYQIKIIRVERDQEYIDRLAERITFLNDAVENILSKL